VLNVDFGGRSAARPQVRDAMLLTNSGRGLSLLGRMVFADIAIIIVAPSNLISSSPSIARVVCRRRILQGYADAHPCNKIIPGKMIVLHSKMRFKR
jgi:hypothetical protein